MNNLYIGLLRLENRAAFFVQAKASQVTPRETAEERFHTLARGWLAYPVTPMHARLPPKSGCRRPSRAKKKDRWLGFQPSVSVSLRSAVRLLVDNTTLFDTSLLACKVAQIVQFCTTHFTKLVDCDAVDKR